MSGTCDRALDAMGGGIAAALNAVDCTSTELTAQTFGRLFAPGGMLGTVLTTLLILYVAFFAIGLMLGRSSLGIRALIPRMITLGLVLTFATSWVAYQSVVWNLAIGAPDWLATILTGTDGSATQNFAAKLDVVFLAVQETTGSNQNFSAFSPPGMMWLGALLLLLGTVGLLVTARIGLALLVALGPIFVVMALFSGTRGLFAGWLKGVTMLSLTPLFAVLGGTIMLELAVPVLAALVSNPGTIDPQAAMAFFLIGAVHCALMGMVLKVAGTMVAGWSVFGLASGKGDSALSASTAPALHQSRIVSPLASPASSAAGSSRKIDISAAATPAPANDGGGTDARARVTNVYATRADSGTVHSTGSGQSRARGIGNRFRSPAKLAAARKSEKFS